jgi:vitamin B12 transporter
MFRSTVAPASFALAASAFPALLYAQPAPEDDAIVVSASRTEQRLRDAIPHTTVITQKDIRDSQAVDLPSLLRREAGFEFSQNGGTGAVTSLFMRGGRGAQTLVLVDGVRVEDAGFGTTAIQHIMLDEVERIEIARGNVSSLYGSGAIGGVINVFTKRGRGEPGPSAEATLGARNTWKLTGGYGGQSGDTRFNVSASKFDTRGFSAVDTRLAPNANPDPDGYRNESVSANLAQRLSAAHEIGVALFRSHGLRDFDNPSGPPTEISRSGQNLGMTQAYWDAQVLERWRSRLTASEGTDYRTDTRNDVFNNSSNTRTRQLIWDNQLRIAPTHEVSLGLETLRQEWSNNPGTGLQQLARNASVARAGYLGKAGDHSLQLNGRSEHYSVFGTANTYFAGYGYDFTEAWRLIASTGTAFRAPTFQDLFGFGGDPTLRPERARTNELGGQWAAGADRIRVVRFETRYQDAITFDPATFTVRNVRKARVDGYEASYSGRTAEWDVRAALTVQDATEQEPGGQELPAIRRAKRFGSLAAYRSFGRLRLGGEVLGSGARPDADIATFARIQNAGYTVVNLTSRYDYDKHLYVAAKLENALDEKYQLVQGFNTPRRGLFFTVGWQP